MSSRLHNKWHRHNHHTTATADINLPDSAHDPIASPETPFQGTFALNGDLSASQSGSFAGDVAIRLQTNNIGLSTNGGAVIDGTSFLNNLNVKVVEIVSPSRSFVGVVSHSGKYIEIIIDSQPFYIPLWLAN
jgi:hypothetical protein